MTLGRVAFVEGQRRNQTTGALFICLKRRSTLQIDVERNNLMGNETRQKKEVDVAKLKEAYEDLNDARMREAEANLALFEATAKKSAARADLEEVSRLRARKEAFHAKLQQLQRAAKENWEQYKAGVEADWSEIERAMDNFQSRAEALIERDRALWAARQDAMDARIDMLAARADQFDAQVRIRFQNDLAGLRAKQADARRKLEEFKRADEAAADDLESGIAAAWNELIAAFKSAFKRY
jgi:hypothetical protein